MNREVAQSQHDTLIEWARQYDAEGVGEGSSEVAFLLKRAARQIAIQIGADPGPELVEKSAASEVTEPKAG